MSRRTPWFRDTYTEEVWGAVALKANEKLVALAYAKYAGTKADPGSDLSWVDWKTLSDMTGLRSKDALNRATRGLVDAGWMTQVEPARQHRSPRYKLTIPTNPEVRVTYIWKDETA